MTAAPLPPAGAAGSPAPGPASPATPPHTGYIASHPASAAFGHDLGLHLRTLVQGGLERAQLHMVIPHLGPIGIRLSLRERVADIQFTAAHEATREGIGRSLEGLRQMLAQEGIALGQAQVDAGGGQGGKAREQAAAYAGAQAGVRAPGLDAGRGGADFMAPAAGLSRAAARNGRGGLLDLYA